jgi:4-hydroxythreonine-4-phosphate dehydrogenase
MNKKILITMGDPNGVGPEICFSALSQNLDNRAILVIVGELSLLKLVAQNKKQKLTMIQISSLEEAVSSNEVYVWNGGFAFESELKIGQVCKKAGLASISWVKAAVLAIQDHKADAMVTAPICKESIEQSIPGFQGHTEYIGEMCGDPEPVLTLIHGNWVVSHVSTHVSLREACNRVQIPRIKKTTKLLYSLLKDLNPNKEPKIGMAGLNPHAGENGMFGDEEIKIIGPAVQELISEGIDVSMPIPADVVFPQLKAQTFDGVVAMFHDQGHVVTKTIAFDLGSKRKLNGVNITLGVDVLRTSVDHGTGFDIAWKGMADHHSLLDAIDVAIKVNK